MKPVPFGYIRPQTLADACRILADDEDALVLAGGQTLIPMLSMRLARPSQLVDISRIDGLAGIKVEPGQITIGAMTRQVEVERSPEIASQLPLLAAAMPWIGHTPTRTRGTIGGSVANADPSAEIPLVLATLGGHIELAHTGGTRSITAHDFFIGPMLTAKEPGECLVAIRLPRWNNGRIGVGFHEVASRKSDFAMVSAAAQVSLDPAGLCTACAVGIGGVTGVPLGLSQAAAELVGTALTDDDIGQVARSAVTNLSAMTDPHASAAYRKRAAAKLIAQALADARDNAQAQQEGTAS